MHRLQASDAAFILRLVNEPSWLRYIGDKGVRTLEDAEQYINNGPGDMYRRFGFGLWLVKRKSDDEAIGICGLLKRDTLDDVDIGFALLPEFWRQGYAYEAASATVQYARKVLGLERLAAIASLDNTASRGLLEKLGFGLECVVRFSPDDDELNLFMLELGDA
ncbi:MAG: GNAT family N-acetyltransferase [Lysobacterales bacterium]